MTTPLYNIGEHAGAFSDGYKKSHHEIEWRIITGLRHRLVHDYEGINWNMIADVVYDELPVFIQQLEKLIYTE